MNKYIYILVLLLLPLVVSAQTIKGYIDNDWPDDRYEVHGDGAVTDRVTGLMWMQCGLGQDHDDNCSGNASEHNWEEALKAAENYVHDDYTDWRLPNIKELFSLAARDRYEPAINITIFPNTPPEPYWSASPSASDSNYAWDVNFVDGGIFIAQDRELNSYVRLVRSVQ